MTTTPTSDDPVWIVEVTLYYLLARVLEGVDLTDGNTVLVANIEDKPPAGSEQVAATFHVRAATGEEAERVIADLLWGERVEISESSHRLAPLVETDEP